jgi:TonB-linked SusC/RagA family outer membrane protein
MALRHLIPALVGTLLLATRLSAQDATGTISGRVVDSASQQPVGSVNIVVEGTRRGAQTREDGSFVIGGVPVGAQRVRASRIGYAPQVRDVTVSAGATVPVTFSLVRQAAVLSEVVVTGYGTQRREAISGSVATVDAEAANVGVIANPNQMLQGRVAGVHMTTNNGEPGAGMQIRVRGGTSISASNDPLYVVDGVPLQNESVVADARTFGGIDAPLNRSPLNTINPNDIESITVLKDASATAIYGSRGANGVILIETKRGARGGTTLQYDTYVSAASPARKLGYLTGSQYRAFIQQQLDTTTTAASRQTWANRLAAQGTANTDWEDEVTRTGYATNHNLSFSGGSPTTQYLASLNYFKQQGVAISSGLTRYQGRLNGQHQAFTGRVRLDLNLTASRVNNDYLAFENGGGFEGGVFTNVAIFNPTFPVRRASGQFYEIGCLPSAESCPIAAQSVRNPVALAEQIIDQAPENRILGNFTGTLSVLPNLTSRTTVGVDYTDAVRQTYFPRTSAVGALFTGLARQADRVTQNINFQQLLTLTPNIGARQELEVLGGYEYTRFDNSGFEVIMQDFVTDVFLWNKLEAGNKAVSEGALSYIQESRLASFFSRANYSFANRYFVTGVIRYDGSSRLAEGNQWSTFPAISASWRLSEEAFMANRPFSISTLAVRAGWGLQGNQAVKPYQTQLLLQASSGARYPFGTGITTGLVAAQVENPNLKWETSEQVNFGLDYGFLNDRISGVVDVYQKTTRDLLLEVSVPQPAVVANRLENIGSVRNRGVEATFNAQLINRGSRTLNAELVAAVERNEVLSLGGNRRVIITSEVNGQGLTGTFSQRIMVGEPLGTFWGPVFTRVETDRSSARFGEQLFRCNRTDADCVNGETGSPRAADEAIIGNANPDFILGLSNTGTWGNFDASWLWRAEMGRDVFNNTALSYRTKSNINQNRNFLEDALSDPDAIGEPAIYSSRWIEDGSFLRLQNVTVGYRFNLPARLGVGAGRSTRVYLSGDNLLLFTGYSGLDPEVFVTHGQSIATRGVDYVAYPRARTFTLGANVQF